MLKTYENIGFFEFVNSEGQPWFLVKITYFAKGSVSLFGETRFELLQGDRNACGNKHWFRGNKAKFLGVA